jgi:hypothetical protein
MEQEQAVGERVKRAQEKMDCWRRSRKKGERMPEGLWEEATSLAKEIGINPVRSLFDLNHKTLKNRVASSESEKRAELAGSGFVELKNQIFERPGACGAEIEVSDPSGMRMCVRLPQGSELNLAQLLEAFRRRH